MGQDQELESIKRELALGVTPTTLVSFVPFDAAFTGTNGGEVLLTVYWNTNEIGLVDERVASPEAQTCRFALPGRVTNSP